MECTADRKVAFSALWDRFCVVHSGEELLLLLLAVSTTERSMLGVAVRFQRYSSLLDSNYYYIVNIRDGKTTLLFPHSF